jgi:sugar phosphate isomerase/epimerase
VTQPIGWHQVSAFGDEVELDLEDQLEALRELDIGNIEIRSAWGVPVDEFENGHVRQARAALDAANMTVSAIASPVGKSALGEPFEDAADRMRRCLHVAGELGASLVRVFSFYVDYDELADARPEVMRRMDGLALLARDAAVTLVHENELGIYGETPERCRDLLDTVASPSLRACFDPANFVQAGCEVFPRAWQLLAPDVAHVHVKDARADGQVTVAAPGTAAGRGFSRLSSTVDTTDFSRSSLTCTASPRATGARASRPRRRPCGGSSRSRRASPSGEPSAHFRQVGGAFRHCRSLAAAAK